MAWMLGGMISIRIKCHGSEAKCMAPHGRIVLILFCASKKHTCASVICQVKPSHISSSSPGGATAYTSNILLMSNLFRDMNANPAKLGRTCENNL